MTNSSITNKKVQIFLLYNTILNHIADTIILIHLIPIMIMSYIIPPADSKIVDKKIQIDNTHRYLVLLKYYQIKYIESLGKESVPKLNKVFYEKVNSLYENELKKQYATDIIASH